MSTGFKPNIFALVIGIDAYGPTVKPGPLMRATVDSDNIRNWLKKMGIPESHIRVLQNKDATREAIIKALQDLSEDARIEYDEPILIYYAGHGSEADAPKEWNWDTPRIQMILPCDYGDNGTDRIAHGIPDRTLGILLSQIADKKGNNITVILDCCHSGSGTRSGTVTDLRVRGVPYKGVIPGDLDEDIMTRGARGFQIHDRFRNAGCRSHVLLAACASHEKAWEDRNSGVFTRALLETFASVDMTKTTNVNLLQQMDVKGQTPQCEGHFRNRLLFNGKVANSAPVYSAKWKNLELIIDAGAFHGIQDGCKFRIWKSKGGPEKRKLQATTVTVETVQAFHSIARPSRNDLPQTSPPSSFFAQILDNPQPKLRVHIPDVIKEMECFKTLFDVAKQRPPLRIDTFANEAEASVGLTHLSKDHEIEIGFKIMTPEERDQEIKYTIPPLADDLYKALRHLSHYFYHRGRTTKVQPPLSSGIKVAMFTLKQTVDYDYERSEEVTLPTDCSPLSLTVGVENEGRCYGFEITNTSKFDVFPHLFYFNSSNFSIEILYHPTTETISSAARVPCPLAANRSLTIGYGSEGAQPLTLCMSEADADFERGCIRLFVPTKNADLSFMKQDEIRQGTSRGFQAIANHRSHIKLWDCITIPTILQKEAVRPSAPRPSIGIIGSKRNGKATFVRQLFESLGVPDLKPSSESRLSLVKGYDITISDLKGSQIECTLVDFPAFEDTVIHNQAETLKELGAWLVSHDREKREFFSLIWCYDISSVSSDVDKLNLDLVKDITGEEMFKNVVVLTTHWNIGEKLETNKVAHKQPSFAGWISPLQRYERYEQQLKTQEMDFKPLVDGKAQFKRFGKFTDPAMARQAGTTNALTVIQQVITHNTPGTLQLQHETSKTNSLSKTTAGERLRGKLEQEIEKEESVLKHLRHVLKSIDSDEVEIDVAAV